MESFVPRKLSVIPDVSPLFGVMLIVIVVFLGFVPLMGYQLPVEIAPVQLEWTEGPLPTGQVVVRVTPDELFLNGLPMTERDFPGALRSSLAGQPDPVVILDAAPDMAYERVVAFLDLFHRVGARTVGLAPDLAAFMNITPAPIEPPAVGAPGETGNSPEPAALPPEGTR
jgi:biopolymer transport protein ExbD